MEIRRATKNDSPFIAPLLLRAMEDIVFQFIGAVDTTKSLQFMNELVALESNQYSYENCWVAIVNAQIVGAVTVYDGANLQLLRQPVATYILKNYGTNFQPEEETQAGEFYIDSIGVNPDMQGKGIGAALLNKLIELYVQQHGKTLGLLVDKENPNAKKLYLKLGFKRVGEKKLVGKTLEHLQLS